MAFVMSEAAYYNQVGLLHSSHCTVGTIGENLLEIMFKITQLKTHKSEFQDIKSLFFS